MIDECYTGTELKYLVTIQSPGFSMADNNFEITIKKGSVSQTFKKEDLILRDGNFYLCFDSTPFGGGIAEAVAKAFVPDADFDDGIRTEVHKVSLVKIYSL